jgi:hypothetical protein
MPTRNIWAIARTIQIPGVQPHVMFDPACVTPRIREAARRMIMNGVLVGGWASKSKKVANLLAAHTGLPFSQMTNRYLDMGRLTEGQATKLRELVQADSAAALLAPKYTRWELRHMSDCERAARHAGNVRLTTENNMKAIDNALRGDSERRTYLHFNDKGFALMAALRVRVDTAYVIEKRKATAALLDLKHPFPLNNLDFDAY